MTCSTCGDRGVVKVNWKDTPADYGVCLCSAGELLRRTTNAGKPCNPGWAIWAVRRGLSLSQIVMLEDVCTPEELAQRGFHELTAADSLDAIAAAARSRKGAR